MTTLLDARGIGLAHFAAAPPFDFRVQAGEAWAIRAAARSGKTTLLKTLAGLMSPRCGDLELLGRRVDALPPSELRALRAAVGVIFATDGLIAPWTVHDNLALPLRYHGDAPAADVRRRIEEAFAAQRLPAEWIDAPVAQLNREQRLRVAWMREWLRRPRLLLVDAQPVDQVLGGARGQGLVAEFIAAGSGVVMMVPAEDPEVVSGTLVHLRVRAATLADGHLALGEEH